MPVIRSVFNSAKGHHDDLYQIPPDLLRFGGGGGGGTPASVAIRLCVGMTEEFKHAHREPLMWRCRGPGAGWLHVELGNTVFICNIKPQELFKT